MLARSLTWELYELQCKARLHLLWYAYNASTSGVRAQSLSLGMMKLAMISQRFLLLHIKMLTRDEYVICKRGSKSEISSRQEFFSLSNLATWGSVPNLQTIRFSHRIEDHETTNIRKSNSDYLSIFYLVNYTSMPFLWVFCSSYVYLYLKYIIYLI